MSFLDGVGADAAALAAHLGDHLERRQRAAASPQAHGRAPQAVLEVLP